MGKSSTMITIECIYTCNSCGKKYETKEEAEYCYQEDQKCICEKDPKVSLFSKFLEYKSKGDFCYYQVLYLNFESTAFEIREVNDNRDRPKNTLVETVAKVDYCPYCGRKL